VEREEEVKKNAKRCTDANKGSSGELIIAADLLSKGYEVFMNCGLNSKADIVFRGEDGVFFVEVRTPIFRSDGSVRFYSRPGDNCDFYAGTVGGAVFYRSCMESEDRGASRKPRKWKEASRMPQE
jgi:hypothetical protein